MTEAQYILADLVLERFPIGTPIYTYRMDSNIGAEIYGLYPQDIYDEIINMVQREDRSIIKFLRDEQYIKCVDSSYPKDELTEKGVKAKQLGGHKQYQEWEATEAKAKNFEDFPKKKWHLFEPLKWVVFFAAGIAIDRYVLPARKTSNETITTPTTDTTNKKTPSLPVPKSLGKKDSL